DSREGDESNQAEQEVEEPAVQAEDLGKARSQQRAHATSAEQHTGVPPEERDEREHETDHEPGDPAADGAEEPVPEDRLHAGGASEEAKREPDGGQHREEDRRSHERDHKTEDDQEYAQQDIHALFLTSLPLDAPKPCVPV